MVDQRVNSKGERQMGGIRPGSILQMQISGPMSDITNQKFWLWRPGICVLPSVPGDSDAKTHPRF